VIGDQLTILDITVTPGVYTNIGSPATDTYNATGYSANDNFIYGITYGSAWGAETNHLVRVGADGATEVLKDLNTEVSLVGPTGQGVMVGDRLYFGVGTGPLAYVDVVTGVTGTQSFTGTPPPGYMSDLSHVVSGGNDYLIGVFDGVAYSFNLNTSVVASATVAGLPSGGDNISKAFGASWSTSDGLVYFSQNGSGTIYVISGATSSTPEVIATVVAAATTFHDGMNCLNGGNPFDHWS